MNKSELVERIASSLGSTRGEANTYLDAVLDGIAHGLAQDGRVKITGFGSFVRRHRPARDGTKPNTGEPIVIPETHTCGFRAAPALRERLACGVASGVSRLPGQVEPKPPAKQDARRPL